MPKIIYYKNKHNNRVPVQAYIDELEQRDFVTHKKVIARLRMLQEYGFELKRPIVDFIEKNMWELRVAQERILFTIIPGENDSEYYLIHAFKKKRQDIPEKEKEIARKRIKMLIVEK